MPYRLLGLAHAAAVSALASLRCRHGQGTVEYVALILLLAGVFAMVITTTGQDDFDIGTTIVNKLKDSINDVGGAPGKKK